MEIKAKLLLLLSFFLFHSLLSLPTISALHPPRSLLSRRLLVGAPRTGIMVQQFLVPHNRERVKLGLPPLQWKKELARFASSRARQRQGDCELVHSGSDYGENLFWGSGKDWKPGDAVAACAEEKTYCNYDTNSFVGGKDCLHYTQMIWRQGLKVGCARVICKSGDTFMTCNYDPHGNVIGQRPFLMNSCQRTVWQDAILF